MVDVDRAAALLDDLAVEEQGLEEIRKLFHERVDEPNSPVAQAVNWMLGYVLIESSDLSGRRRFGAAFAPLWESKEGVFPPYLDKLPNRESSIAIWRDLARHVRHPVISGRVNDLLWCADSGGERHHHARNAIEAYLSAADNAGMDESEFEQLIDAVQGLGRERELSLELNAHDLLTRVDNRIADLLRHELQSEEAVNRPGVWMRLFAPLVSLQGEDRPGDLGELLAGAHLLATDRPDIRLAHFQMQERLARGDQSETRRIRRSAVAMLILEARRQTDGLSRQHWFLEALDLARHNGVGQRTELCIRRALQQIDLNSIDWQEYSYSTNISNEEIEGWIDAIVGDNRLESALERFALVGGPPVGDRERTERTVDDLAQKFVFQNMFARVVADEQGFQIRRVESPEQKRDLDILEHESRSVQIDGWLRQLALDRIPDRYAIESASLRRLFSTSLIEAGQADAFARAFEHFWSDRSDEALLIALPRIEAVLRRLFDLRGGAIYHPPRDLRPGRVLGLGDVLRGLENLSTADEAEWFRSFRVALTEPLPGLNLRNRHLHGLTDQAEKPDAAIVLRIAALLRLVEVQLP